MAITLPTPAEVKAIIKTSLDDDAVMAYINDAALLVEGCVSPYDEGRQKAIVKYVAAHLIATGGRGGDDALVTSKKLGDASKTFARATSGDGYNATPFGRQALMLDLNGCLSARRKPVFQVL